MDAASKATDRSARPNVVTCKCGQLDGAGTYAVEGRYLVVKSTLGVLKAAVGLGSHRRVARTLLKNYCMRAAAATPAEQARQKRPPTASTSTDPKGRHAHLLPRI